MFTNQSDAIEYCNNKLIDIEQDYGIMTKSGRSYGGSEIDNDYKTGVIPSNYIVASYWAEFVQMNAKGNPVNRMIHIKAIYLNA